MAKSLWVKPNRLELPMIVAEIQYFYDFYTIKYAAQNGNE